jgi:hypothetical protein
MIGCVGDDSNTHDERQADSVANEIDVACEQTFLTEEIAEGILTATSFLDAQILSERHFLDTTSALPSDLDTGGGVPQSNKSVGSTMQSDDEERRQETGE